MSRQPRYVYSVRRARKNLLDAIRAERDSYRTGGIHLATGWVSHTTVIARREAAVRDLIASVQLDTIRILRRKRAR